MRGEIAESIDAKIAPPCFAFVGFSDIAGRSRCHGGENERQEFSSHTLQSEVSPITAHVHRAVLLAAGQGTRLKPATDDRPKPMVEIAGRPILERILESLRATGIDEAMIVHGYLGEVIQRYFGDGERVGMRLQYRAQQALTGTAEALMLAEEFCGNEPFLMQWGDILVDPDNYTTIVRNFQADAGGCVCRLGINWVEDPFRGGAVYRDAQRVTKVIEKPAPGTAGTHWNIGGVIVFSPKWWGYLHETKPPEHGEFYITQGIDLMIERGETVLVHEIIGERVHITSLADLEKLQHDPRIPDWEIRVRRLA